MPEPPPAAVPAAVPPGTPRQRSTDRVTLRLAVFVAGLVVALVAGFGLGRLAGSTSPTPTPLAAGQSQAGQAQAGHAHPTDAGAPLHGTTVTGTGTATAADAAGGLSVSAGGYTLVPESTAFQAGVARPFRFRVQGPDGAPVTGFAVVHDKPMHLVVVRRDLTGYRHLHPGMAPDGTWSVNLALPEAGSWRAYADFTAIPSPPTAGNPAAGNPAAGDPAGPGQPAAAPLALTLGADLVVAGDYRPRALPAPARESTVDGFLVTYEGTPQVGSTQPLLLRVFRNGFPVTADLQRYLGSYGHLVVLREGDLGYLHVHPEQELASGAVKFWLAAPGPGRYRMYFDFQAGGVVRTAEFSATVR